MNDADKVALALVITAAIIGVAIVIATVAIRNTGRVISFGVTADVSEIDWGDMAPGLTKQVSFNVTSNSSIDGALTMTHTAPSYLTLTWDSEGVTLTPDETRAVTFMLTASDTAQPQSFSFDITITLTGGES